MLTRLEEFQTMISFVHQDRDESNKILISVLDANDDFNDLCKKIDKIECLVAHIKNNLNALDEEISKTEENLGCLEQSTLKMPSIFTPLFVRFLKNVVLDIFNYLYIFYRKKQIRLLLIAKICNWRNWKLLKLRITLIN